jgi:hypothetical protein
VILVDANLLIYAHIREMPRHAAARDWLDRQLNELPRVGLPWPSLLAFIRIVSNPRVLERPVAVQDAWRQAEDWLQAPAAWVPVPTARHRETLGLLLGAAGARSSLVADAHLAALAIEHGLTLCSTDGDFARFPGLRWQDPLARGA